MYSGEIEVQAKRKTIAILQDETNKILGFSRELSTLTNAICNNDKKRISETFERMNEIEKDITILRKQITREVIAIGSLMTYREDLLRTAYFMDEISGFIGGISFRLSNIDPDIIKKYFESDIQSLIDIIINTIFKMNEMCRSLTIKPENTIELANEIQKIEHEMDLKYRNIIIKALDNITTNKDLILFKDVVEGIEGMVDKCQQASNSFTILALSI
ncbi:MAG: DUF47 family protein [Thermoproteota archaeon]|nr:DUF47 family protein [Thermoproteota archaeon]